MADINLAVTPASDKNPATVTFTLDPWEWTSLSVNGNSIPPANKGNIQFQTTVPLTQAAPITFEATADHNLIIVNPGTYICLAGPTKEHSYTLLISYATNADRTVTLSGLIVKTGYFGSAAQSPQYFSQGRMTGTFSD